MKNKAKRHLYGQNKISYIQKGSSSTTSLENVILKSAGWAERIPDWDHVGRKLWANGGIFVSRVDEESRTRVHRWTNSLHGQASMCMLFVSFPFAVLWLISFVLPADDCSNVSGSEFSYSERDPRIEFGTLNWNLSHFAASDELLRMDQSDNVLGVPL